MPVRCGRTCNAASCYSLLAHARAQYKYVHTERGFTLTCDPGIALGPRLELYPMDNGHPHRGTSQFPVSVHDKGVE